MLRYPNLSDLALCLSFDDADGNPDRIRPKDVGFSIELLTRGPKVILDHTAGSDEVTSSGDIAARCTIDGSDLHIYAKTSAVHFGDGRLRCRIAFRFACAHFSDGEQVLNILPAPDGMPDGPYELETNIIIISDEKGN